MDGFSIRVASKELQRRSERRKILFTLSDGQPNGPYNYSGDRGENDVTEAVLDARKNGISVFNIFFAESKRERDSYLPSFRHMYRDKGIISCAPEQIAHELLRVVKRELQA
jgi:nitric oxide reductase activation protein